MLARATIASLVAGAAAAADWPLFTGNGFLAREVMSVSEPGKAPVLPLQGGMGLSSGVAAGFLLASRFPGAFILEGDGNHLMGWGGAQFIGDLGLTVVHVVSCNGLYHSTGGQRIPHSDLPLRTESAAATLHYRRAFRADSPHQLSEAIATAITSSGPTLVYVLEDPSEAPPPRSPFNTAEYAAALRHAVVDKDMSRRPAIVQGAGRP